MLVLTSLGFMTICMVLLIASVIAGVLIYYSQKEEEKKPSKGENGASSQTTDSSGSTTTTGSTTNGSKTTTGSTTNGSTTTTGSTTNGQTTTGQTTTGQTTNGQTTNGQTTTPGSSTTTTTGSTTSNTNTTENTVRGMNNEVADEAARRALNSNTDLIIINDVKAQINTLKAAMENMRSLINKELKNIAALENLFNHGGNGNVISSNVDTYFTTYKNINLDSLKTSSKQLQEAYKKACTAAYKLPNKDTYTSLISYLSQTSCERESSNFESKTTSSALDLMITTMDESIKWTDIQQLYTDFNNVSSRYDELSPYNSTGRFFKELFSRTCSCGLRSLTSCNTVKGIDTNGKAIC